MNSDNKCKLDTNGEIILIGDNDILNNYQYTNIENIFLPQIDWNIRETIIYKLDTPLNNISDFKISKKSIAFITSDNNIITIGDGRYGGNIYREYPDMKSIEGQYKLLSDNNGFTLITEDASYSWGHWTLTNRNELYIPSLNNIEAPLFPIEQE